MPRRPPAVARVLERVTATVREHEMFLPGDTVLVAVSGGPDSTCLLYSLWHLRRLLRVRLEVFHFDHRLRADSANDADYVRRAATRLKVPFHPRTAEAEPGRGESVEAWARKERLAAALAVRLDVGARRMALGHTMDDQVENVLMALVRGGGLDSVSGIRPTQAWLAHPLLDVRRTEVEAFVRALHLRPRLDPTNRDARLLRNALRLRAIPAMEKATGREVRGPIARSASILRRDADALRQQAMGAAKTVVEEVPDGVILDTVQLLTLSPAVAARVVRFAFVMLPGPASEESIEGVLDLAAGRPGRRRDLPGGLIAMREQEYVLLSRSSPGA